MCWSTFTLGDIFARLSRKRGLRWLALYHDPASVVTAVNMRSLNSLVTDSAAASSSWGSGSRVINGTLNVLPDGRKLRPLAALFGDAGWRRGLVTTTEITHATPAGFAVSVESRGSAEEIARQYLDRRVEILLGGGMKYFSGAQRSDKWDLYGAYRSAGYTVCRKAAELEDAPLDRPVLGTFAEGHLPFSLDRDHDPELRRTVPSLAGMTRRALRQLAPADHFLLQVEGGRVDHACHANDIAAAVHDLVAFDEAVEVVLEFQRRVPETLVVITTDHGTGGPALNGMGAKYGESSPLFAHLPKARCSFEALLPRLPKEPSAVSLDRLLREATGYEAPEAKLRQLADFLAGKWTPLFEGLNGRGQQFGAFLANYYGVSWTSGAHTADYVPLLATGPGAERFRGWQQNTDIFRHYTDLAGIDFRNPQTPLLAECGPAADEVEPEAWPV